MDEALDEELVSLLKEENLIEVKISGNICREQP